MGKRPAAKSTARKSQKPSPKAAKNATAAKPAKSTASRRSAPAPGKPAGRERTAGPVTESRDVGRYTPQEITGIGRRPFRYPPE